MGQIAYQLLGSQAQSIPEIGEYIMEVLNEEKRFEKSSCINWT